jgi:hypothetical protein
MVTGPPARAVVVMVARTRWRLPEVRGRTWQAICTIAS